MPVGITSNIVKRKKAFTMVEVALSMFLIMALVTILFATVGVYRHSRNSNLQTIAAKITSREIEKWRKAAFASLPVNNTYTFTDSDLSKLPASSATETFADFCQPSCSADIKLLTVNVNWTEQGVAKNVKMETVISKNGL